MISKNNYIKHPLRIAVGVTALVLLLAGGAGAGTLTVDDSGGKMFTGIQDAINASSAGDTILVYSGTYYENVNVTKQLILRGIDTAGGMPVVDARGSGSAITLFADRITLEGFTVTRAGDYPEAGIKVTSNNNTLRSNNASNNSHRGIYLYSSNNNTLSGNNASNNTNGIGIYLWASNNNTLYSNIAFSNNAGGIVLKSSSNSTLTGNIASLNYDGGIVLESSSNNMLSGNIFVKDGTVVIDSFRNIMEYNIVNGKPLVYIENVTDYRVIDAGQVILVNSKNITVENLDLSNTAVGIELWMTNNSKIQNNNVSNNMVGIVFFSSNNNTLSGNNALDYGYGIRLTDSNSNLLIDNNASLNSREGIGLISSSNNTLIGNNASLNRGSGIFMGSASNNTLIGNNANSNGFCTEYSCYGYGIYLWASSNNNRIYHNNFINNTNQATDESDTNVWSSTYPSGGNYWSDYTGFDLKSGSSQNIPGSDGIGDTPYNISGGTGAEDRYPFMKINGWQSSITTITATPISGGKGDVSGDSQVTVVDALFVAQYTVGLRTLTSQQLAAADVERRRAGQCRGCAVHSAVYGRIEAIIIKTYTL